MDISKMQRQMRRGLGAAGLVLVMSALSGCGDLPRSGPRSSTILDQDPEATVDVALIPLTMAVAQQLTQAQAGGFEQALLDAPTEDTVVINKGDILSIAIWENVEEGLFSSVGSRGAIIEDVAVDETGRVFIPYVGLVQAQGRTLGAVRESVRKALDAQTLKPQVDVRRATARNRSLVVMGDVAKPGLVAIEDENNRLLAAIAAAGGATQDPRLTEVQLRRNGQIGRVWLDQLYDDPRLDVPVHRGDRVILRKVTPAYNVLGAVAAPGRITMTDRKQSLADALANARGLDDDRAHVTGVFVFRTEPPALADKLAVPRRRAHGLAPLPKAETAEGRGVVYHLDMARAESLLTAAAFPMRDGDIVYVSNAPLTDLQKMLRLILPSISALRSTATLGAVN